STEELLQLISDLPYETREILEKVKNGKIKIVFEHKGLDPMLITHERISNRLAFSIVLASIVIGSSLVAFSRSHHCGEISLSLALLVSLLHVF
ncbi:MAG: hypothetical protein IMY71_01545, partial [Bacteroidetes bacterium]|nr:hypothetical protein [Bacteroidota bacterium]